MPRGRRSSNPVTAPSLGADDYQVALALDGLIATGRGGGADVASLRSRAIEIHVASGS